MLYSIMVSCAALPLIMLKQYMLLVMLRKEGVCVAKATTLANCRSFVVVIGPWFTRRELSGQQESGYAHTVPPEIP